MNSWLMNSCCCYLQVGNSKQWRLWSYPMTVLKVVSQMKVKNEPEIVFLFFNHVLYYTFFFLSCFPVGKELVCECCYLQTRLQNSRLSNFLMLLWQQSRCLHICSQKRDMVWCWAKEKMSGDCMIFSTCLSPEFPFTAVASRCLATSWLFLE